MSDDKPGTSDSNPPIIVIFGITGDLSQRYLLPALYHLTKDGGLDPRAEIVGITRRDVSADQLFEQVELCVNEIDKICDPAALRAMHDRTRMVQMDLDDPEAYVHLRQTLDAIEDQKGMCLNRLYYLAIPPQVYRPIVRHMGTAGLHSGCRHGTAVSRLLVEKPFGFDLASAQELIGETGEVFREEQIFRVDHFLAKQTVQAVLDFRFHNPDLETMWNHEHITSIEISASEQITIEGRVEFYDPLGALRDFIQNHLLQLSAIVTMDRPAVMDSEHLHTVKAALLKKIQPIPADQVPNRTVRGQYRGYREEVNNPATTTETYAAISVYIKDDRWQGIPISLWTGKAMSEKNYEIIVNLKGTEAGTTNSLRFHIQPEQGLELQLSGPDSTFHGQLRTAVETFSRQTQSSGQPPHPDAYERVFNQAIQGDHALFVTSDEVLASWRIIQPVLEQWATSADDLIIYEPGSEGPLVKHAR